LIKLYNQEMPIQASGGAVLRNPLIKNKGRIRDDWTMPDEHGDSSD
jgi:hypothetical protein